jgi:hypothetical protein
VKRQIARSGALIIVLLATVAWFAASNHCALAAFNSTADALAVHARCHGNAPSPAKEPNGEQLPCCKVLRATVAQNIEADDNIDKLWQPIDYAKSVDASSILRIASAVVSTEFDTGPPVSVSFAELVLQRSLLSHAPPSLV